MVFLLLPWLRRFRSRWWGFREGLFIVCEGLLTFFSLEVLLAAGFPLSVDHPSVRSKFLKEVPTLVDCMTSTASWAVFSVTRLPFRVRGFT